MAAPTEQFLQMKKLKRYSIKSLAQQSSRFSTNLQKHCQEDAGFRALNETELDASVAHCSDAAETFPPHLVLNSHQMAQGHQNVCNNNTITH